MIDAGSAAPTPQAAGPRGEDISNLTEGKAFLQPMDLAEVLLSFFSRFFFSFGRSGGASSLAADCCPSPVLSEYRWGPRRLAGRAGTHRAG